jgi:hypothetical protein
MKVAGVSAIALCCAIGGAAAQGDDALAAVRARLTAGDQAGASAEVRRLLARGATPPTLLTELVRLGPDLRDQGLHRELLERLDAAGKPAANRPAPRTWRPLPDTAREADECRAVFRAAFPAASVRELRRRQATKPHFTQQVSGMRYLHVATHGFGADAASAPADRPHSLGPRAGERRVRTTAGWAVRRASER